MGEWKAYFPEDGETAEDAIEILGVFDADYAAQQAVEYDYGNRDGWERVDREFPVVVIDPDGNERRYIGWNEPTVEHRAALDKNGTFK